MSKSSTRTNLTPPIRSIAAEASSILSSNEIDLDKVKMKINSSEQQINENSSNRSSSSSSSSSSSVSFSFANGVDDDISSNDETNVELVAIEERLRSLRRLMPPDTFSLSDTSSITRFPIIECQVCLEESSIRPLNCCSSPICSSCIYSHLSSHISEAQIRIACPSCPHIFTREEILLLLVEKDFSGEIAERYKRFYADINREPNIKTCPQCCAIKEIDKKLFENSRHGKNIPRHVTCDECRFEWCFYCHAPWHDKMTCREYQKGEKMLRSWAAQMDNNQQNAQQCPRCKVFISRNGGCPHMICSKCHCDFCYNCGKRRLGVKFLGSHESRFSPFGCKYNLYPDKPILRYTVRGLVAGAATLAAPVAAVGAVALLAVGTTIGAPTYGTYRLVKHIRNKRRNRHLRHLVTERETNETNTDDDDLTRAIQASLESYREERERRQSLTKENSNESDDDSFDD